MCGIFGMISKKPRRFNKRAFCTMGVRNDSRGGDSCGIFIDGKSEYGIDNQKTFINFFRDSEILENTFDCKVALGHCRKASIGKISLETAQPVVLTNENNEVEYVLIHNGTIHNYKELAKKYIPNVNIDGLTDSQVMARIFYYKGYDVLDEYIGGAVFVIYDYRIDKSFVFKGSSKRTKYFKDAEEERPLYYCWHNGRFVFSSIYETLYAFYYEETVYRLPSNKLVSIGNKTLESVKDYPRENATQQMPFEYTSTYSTTSAYKITFDGFTYNDPKGNPVHGIFHVSAYGWLYDKKAANSSWLETVAFYNGKMLKHPKAFDLIEKVSKDPEKIASLNLLINMMDYNPFSDNFFQYYWCSDDNTLMIPQGEWKYPMADWAYEFDNEGMLKNSYKASYTGWLTDYRKYEFNEGKILKAFEKICEEQLYT
jgi:predicted glutamine amidotransferase